MSQRPQRLIEAARKAVPEGTYAVGLGLVLSGLTAYGFQILAFRGLSKSDYAALNGLWIFLFVVAPGFFLPLEQEVGRAVADRRARHLGGGPVVRKAALAGALLASGLVLLALAGAAVFPLVDRLFHGRDVLLVCFVIGLATYAVQHLTRGTLSGNGRFGPYGMILGAEGVFRIAPVIVIYAAGIDDLVWYGGHLSSLVGWSDLLCWRQRGAWRYSQLRECCLLSGWGRLGGRASLTGQDTNHGRG